MAELFGVTISGIEFEFQKVTYLGTGELRYSAWVFYGDERYYLRMKKDQSGVWKIITPPSELPDDIFSLENDLNQAIVQNERSENRGGFLG